MKNVFKGYLLEITLSCLEKESLYLFIGGILRLARSPSPFAEAVNRLRISN